ncbi:MAG TPA: peptide deformylase [Jiangellaceae bacterium]|nr:peptide deformylase [Jiangellaceae bacterium]
MTVLGWSEHDLRVAGRVLPVVPASHPVLAAASERVDPTDEKVVQLAADLVATMRVSPGCVGLAAPQVGVGWHVFCVDVTSHVKARTTHGTFALCNAEAIEASGWEQGREGCMSVPDLTGVVKRATRLVVAGELAGSAERVVLETDAFEARVVQHEIDHCEGLLFLDRVAGAHAVFRRRVYR